MNLDEILIKNRDLLINSTVDWLKITNRSRTMEFDKCTRDIGYIYDAWLIDLENDSTAETHRVTSKYWIRGTSQLKTTHVELLAYDYINTLINNIHPSTAIDNLVSITKHNILNPPVFAPGTFNYSTANRITTYNWTDQIPERQLIDNIMQGIHNFVPSKQNVVRYNIRIIPAYTMPDLRQTMYVGTEADPGNPTTRYNPQVLAPYVIAIAPSLPKDSNNYVKYESGVEVGLAAMYISLAAPAVGLDVGLCACIQNEAEMEDLIGIRPTLYLGIGYKSNNTQLYCPVYNTLVGIPVEPNKKPSIEEYVKYV